MPRFTRLRARLPDILSITAIIVNGAARKCVPFSFMRFSGELRLIGMNSVYFALMQMKLTTANDNMLLGYNMPLGCNMPLGDNLPEGIVLEEAASAPLVLSSSYTPLNSVLTSQNARTPKRKKTGGRTPVFALLLLWLIIAAAIARFAGSEEGNLITSQNLVMTASGFGLLSLWLASLARRRGAKISHSIGIAGACLSLAGLAWIYFSTQAGNVASIIASPELFVMSIAAVSLVLAKLWRTPFLLHFSMFMMIGWSSYVFINASISNFVWLFPVLWSLQMLLAMNFRIKRTIALSIFSGLFWIGANLLLLA